jgi:hypothetical protein
VQPTNQSLHGFEAQTKKPSWWFWGPNHQTVAAGFEAQLENPPAPWFWGSTKKPTAGFEAKPGETVTTSFEAKLEKIITTGFEAKPPKTVVAGFEAKLTETVTTGFDAKPVKTVWLVLRPNHSQTVNLGFEAQPRNPLSSSPRARCRPHMSPPDLSIAWPPSTRPVWPSSVLYTRSPTPAMILIIARHAAPAICTPRDKQMWFSKQNKDKRKTNETILDSNSNLAKSMTHHNQTKELTTWFLRDGWSWSRTMILGSTTTMGSLMWWPTL